MTDEAPTPPPGAIDRADRLQPLHDTRNTWVALSIVEARAIAAEAMAIVARSRAVCLGSQRRLATDPTSARIAVAAEEDTVLSPSPPSGS